MKKIIFLIIFIFLIFIIRAQDSLRLVLPIGHNKENSISVEQFSKDGKYLITTSEKSSYWLWDVESGKEIFKFRNNLEDCLFSPEGKYILLEYHDEFPNHEVTKIEIIDVANLKKVSEFEIKNASLVRFAPGDKYIIASSRNDIYICQIETGKIKHQFSIHSSPIFSAFFSQDEKIITLLSEKGEVTKWDNTTGELISKSNLNQSFSSNVKKIHDGLYLFSDSLIWEIETGKRIDISQYNGSEKIVSPSANYIVLFSEHNNRKKVRLIDLRTGKEIFSIYTDDIFYSDILFSSDEKQIALPIRREFVQIWDINSGKLKMNIKSSGGTGSCQFTPDGKRIAFSSWDSEVAVWDIESGKEFRRLKGYTNELSYFNISPSSKMIATASYDRSVRLWNLVSFDQSSVLRHNKSINSVEFSPDEKFILTSTDGGQASLWDTKSGKEIQSLSSDSIKIKNIKFNPNGKGFLTNTEEGKTILWSIKKDLIKFKPDYTINIFNNEISISEFTPDGKYFITATNDSKDYGNTSSEYLVRLWEVKTGKFIRVLSKHRNHILSVAFSPLGKYFASASYDQTVQVWEVATGKKIYTFKGSESKIGGASMASVQFSRDEKYLITTSDCIEEISWNEPARIFNLHTGKEEKFWNEAIDIAYAQFSPDGKYMLTISWDNFTSANASLDDKTLNSGILCIWDVECKKVLHTLRGHKGTVFGSAFSPDSKFIFTHGNDHKSIIWNVQTGKPICEKYYIEEDDWLVKLPNSPYYMCSRNASKKLHYVTPNLKVIGFEQLDPIYNRPDIVLDSIRNYFSDSDIELITQYRSAWEKRIDRLGLNKERIGKVEIVVPNAEITDADNITYDNKTGVLTFKVNASDSKYKLQRFNIFINEVPIYGSEGVSISHLNKNKWDTTVTVKLGIGENKIQVSVMNELGLENFKYPTYVKHTPESNLIPKTHFIGIGVNLFKQNGHNLSYCVKDANDLADALKSKNTKIKLLTDEMVIRENILSLKKYLIDSTSINDKVIISCSSHGLLDDSLNFYLATYDVDFTSPKKRGLAYEDLESLFDGIPARKKILLLDACNSGENDNSIILKKQLEENKSTMDSAKLIASRGAIIEAVESNISKFKKVSELFVNVKNNTGSVIISAAGGLQSAKEGESVIVDGSPIKNGAFTFCVLEYLIKEKQPTVKGLKQYVESRVQEITNGDQIPTSRQETMEVDWEL